MENSKTFSKQHEITGFITGYENISFGGMAQERKIVALAWISILITIQNALSLALYIKLHVENSMLSVVVFLFGILLFLMVNKMYFISSSKAGSGFKEVLLYMGFYIAMSYLITSSVLCFFLLETEILEITSSKSTLNKHAGMAKLVEHLSPEQERSYNEFKYTTFFISVIIASLPAITQKLLINHKELFSIENRNNDLRTSLYIKLQQKKSEYAKIYEQPIEGDLFGGSVSSDEEDIQNKKDLLMTEIKHLEDAIQNIL